MTPQEYLVYVNKRVPSSVWTSIDYMRANMGKECPEWPPYVFLPYTGWYVLTATLLGKNRLELDDMALMQAITIAGTWRVTQDIVQFDPDLYASIIDTPLTGDLPCDVFYQLPAWCVWIETIGMTFCNIPILGFWALLEHDTNDGHDELRIYFLPSDGIEIYPIILQFGDGSLQDAMQRVVDSDVKKGMLSTEIAEKFSDIGTDNCINQAVNLLLYVCSYGFPGHQRGEGGYAPQRPCPVKTKKGWRLFPAQRPTYHTLGKEIGEAIREHSVKNRESQGTHAGPRPHVRRAHWHGYWYGTKKVEEGKGLPDRRFSLKWLPPIPVAMKDDEDDGNGQT